jgi:hypothetical protein
LGVKKEQNHCTKVTYTGGFLEKPARPPSSESPLKYEITSYLSIANYAVNLDSCGNIHCALGTSDFDAQKSDIKIYKGNEILRPVYKKPFSKILHG